MRGDAGDGVPNVLSPDDTFVSEQHQNQLRQTRVDEWINNIDELQIHIDNDFMNLSSFLGIIAYYDHHFIAIRRSNPANSESAFIEIDNLCNVVIRVVEEKEVRELVENK